MPTYILAQIRDSMFIITGGGTGLGKALALALAARDKPVLIVARRQAPLQETAALSSLIDYLCADVSTQEGIDAVVNKAQHLPQLEGLVNNAGTLQPLASLHEMPLDAWNQALATNLNAALMLPQRLYTRLTHGRVLNIGSGAAYFAIKGWAAYCVSKAALAMLTQCWQLESPSVAFAHVMPGIVDTEMQAIARTGVSMDKEQSAFYQQLKQNNRLLTPEAVAQFLVWLLLDVDKTAYSAKEWDIYDSSHHNAWLSAAHQIPHWNS